jgi:geranylgeranyl reductase family protein
MGDTVVSSGASSAKSAYDVIIVGAGPAGATAATYLAEAGLHCLLIEKEELPRKKTCAGWLNRAVFEIFPYLAEAKERFISAPFYSLIFNSTDLEKRAEYKEERELGYLVKRDVFDAFLVGCAKDAGCEVKDGCTLTGLVVSDDAVKAELSDGTRATARMIIGADGTRSDVARSAGLNPGWPSNRLILCLNKDIPVEKERLDAFYGAARPIHVSLGYSFVSGYAWIFPKCDEIAVGIGGRASSTQGLGQTFERFVHDAVRNGILPDGLDCSHPDSGLIPAGAGLDLKNTASKRVLLVGDAAGFASGSTGEGIFPAMRGAKIAADAARDALASNHLEDMPAAYEQAWRRELEGYIKPPETSELLLLPMIYSFKKIREKVARKFLFGMR